MPRQTLYIALNLLIALIGAYLLLAFSNGDALTPPIASGIGFILVAALNLIHGLRK